MSRRMRLRQSRISLRQTWVWLHRWLGLSVGLLVALLGLSGAALVLKGPLLRWELGTMLDAPAAGERSSPDTWVTAALAAHGGPGTVMSVTAPQAGPIPANSALLFLSEPAADGGVRHPMIAVDPGNRPGDGPGGPRVLGVVIFEDTWFSRLLGLHRSLLAGEAGGTAVALCGLLLMLSLASGLALWWQRGGSGMSGWRRALWPSRPAAAAGRLRALHGAAGLWLVAPLAILALSGTLLARPDWLPLRTASKPAAATGPDTPEPPGCAGPPDLAQAIRTAVAAHPGRAFRSAGAGAGPNAPFLIAFADGLVLVERRCGTLQAATAADGPPVQAVRRLLGGLHAELMLGTAGRALVFAAGLSLPLLWATGLWFWLRGRKSRNAGQARRSEATRHG